MATAFDKRIFTFRSVVLGGAGCPPGVNACDDLKSYGLSDPVAPGSNLNGGAGWNGAWNFENSAVGIVARDRLSDYVVAFDTAATLNAGTGWNGAWSYEESGAIQHKVSAAGHFEETDGWASATGTHTWTAFDLQGYTDGASLKQSGDTDVYVDSAGGNTGNLLAGHSEDWLGDGPKNADGAIYTPNITDEIDFGDFQIGNAGRTLLSGVVVWRGDTGIDNAWQAILSQYSFADQTFFLGIAAGRQHLVIISANAGGTTRKRYHGSTLSAGDTDWHMTAFTYNNGTLKLYEDGTENASPTKAQDDAMTTFTDGAVGVRMLEHAQPAEGFKGYVAFAGLWDVELSSTNISDLWNGGDLVAAGSEPSVGNMTFRYRGGPREGNRRWHSRSSGTVIRLTQSVAGDNPTYQDAGIASGEPSVRFDGSGDHLDLSSTVAFGTSDFSIVIAGQFNSDCTVLYDATNGRGVRLNVTSDLIEFDDGTTVHQSQATGDISATTRFFGIARRGGKLYFYDGDTDVSAGSPPTVSATFTLESVGGEATFGHLDGDLAVLHVSANHGFDHASFKTLIRRWTDLYPSATL